MKFGLEAEKFIFNLSTNRPSKGVFSFIDALSDYRSFNTDKNQFENKVTNEFVLNMVEFSTTPSFSPMEVLKDYLFNYLLLQEVASREQVAIVPFGALPMDYLPQMTPKWPYYVQNSVLAGRKQKTWTMEKNSPLRAAGNCAGIHAHIELETRPEFLFSNQELKSKFNMGVMLSPLIAFSSSPYFFGKHEANSMRALRYYEGVYKKSPLNGGLPPIMETSQDVLNYVLSSIHNWEKMATKVGFKHEEIQLLLSKKSANWNPVRWNSQWNTIEMRFLDSDSIEMDATKFVWICTAMKCLDLKGDALETEVLKTKKKKLDRGMLDEVFRTSGKKICILPTEHITELFNRAMMRGTKDPLVEHYLYRLEWHCLQSLDIEYRWLFKILQRSLASHLTTSESILKKTRGKARITNETAVSLVLEAMDNQNKIISSLRKYLPDVFQHLEESGPQSFRGKPKKRSKLS